ncbi:MAG: hypothetical protein PHQ22_09100 [Sulfuricurvum sp.]|nr:hypothetical protein [Sulfuricurvum sp.]
MKTLLKLAIATLILTSVAQAAPKWIKPSKSVCVDNGGTMEGKECKATWDDAKEICSSMNAQLPAIGKFKGMITNCGGIVNNYRVNTANLSYQSCIKSLGFAAGGNNFYWYWSSNVSEKDTSYVRVMDSEAGDIGNEEDNYGFPKSNDKYVICVRGGQ